LVVFFLGTTPIVDLAGAELLAELHHTLRERGVDFRLADVLSNVRETLVRAGLEKECGAVVANEPVATVIQAWRQRDRKADNQP
jgi:anti-anti-sigma regulatory factor